jgi:hypothetical protein
LAYGNGEGQLAKENQGYYQTLMTYNNKTCNQNLDEYNINDVKYTSHYEH